jgi:DDE superfamily endonuclease
MKMGGWQAKQLVFLDESGINTRNGERTHGWAPKGHVLRYKAPASRGENFSLLPAMTIDGYIACKVYSGSVNSDTFKAFIVEDVLPLCGRYPDKYSILIMDNARIHTVDTLTFK